MARYTTETRVAAPLDTVWEFYASPGGLETLTPDFLGLRVEAIRHPESVSDPDLLVAGTEVDASVRPFGVGPRQEWTSRIVEYNRGDHEARFVDEMVDGPLERWIHTHEFVDEGDVTLVRDEVDWAPSGGPLGEGLARLGVVGLAPTFFYRHRLTRELLEG